MSSVTPAMAPLVNVGKGSGEDWAASRWENRRSKTITSDMLRILKVDRKEMFDPRSEPEKETSSVKSYPR